MTVEPTILRQAMRQWATGVTIVTSQYDDQFHGMTVSSFTSISLAPPLVLVSLEQTARTHAMVVKAGHFGVTILEEGQKDISNRFADPRMESSLRFADVETFEMVSGVPFIAGGLAFFDCKLLNRYKVSTHSIIVGEVLAAKSGVEGGPLLYYDRDYQGLIEKGENT